MHVIKFAREMRARGYRHTNRARGQIVFGLRFSNMYGVSRVFHTQALSKAEMTPAALADLCFREDHARAGFDMSAV